MNRVGHDGRGESVWLGWFLLMNLRDFARVAERRGEEERAARWRNRADSFKASLEEEGWDGEWYRRAFFDDGTPLGSAENDECQIDSIAQSWAVISGAGNTERARRAMESVEQRLVRRDDRLMLLFSPPFDQTPLDPGYVKGYLPGVRENGGQYTHAAIWSAVAFAMLGEGDTAVDLFKLLSPIHHAGDRTNVDVYKVEPYAVVADVYSETPQVWSGFSDSRSEVPPSVSIRAFPRSGKASRSPTVMVTRSTGSPSKTRRESAGGYPESASTDPRFRQERLSRWPTTLASIRSRWCSDRHRSLPLCLMIEC
jgi:hypothetical protein